MFSALLGSTLIRKCSAGKLVRFVEHGIRKMAIANPVILDFSYKMENVFLTGKLPSLLPILFALPLGIQSASSVPEDLTLMMEFALVLVLYVKLMII